MIPIKDIIPPQTQPVVALGILALSVAGALIALGRGTSEITHLILLAADFLLLWVFADNVEDQLGHDRFALLYGLCGAAGIAARALLPGSDPFLVGITSGAVSGVLGAYLTLYPRSRVLVLVPFPLQLHEVPALFALTATLVLHLAGGVEPFAVCLVGLVAGGLLCLILRRPERGRIEWWGQIREQGGGIREQRD